MTTIRIAGQPYKFYVEINYKKGPTFSTEIIETSEFLAKSTALKHAKDWGFTHPVKRIIVRGV